MTREQRFKRQCEAFNRKHPEVWELFAEYTLDRIALGFKHYGGQTIWERIRWHTDSERVGGDPPGLKLDNNYVPFYTRRFMRMHPEHKGFFRTREQASKVTPAKRRGRFSPGRDE